MSDMVPWPKGPQPCRIELFDNGTGYIHFIDPRPLMSVGDFYHDRMLPVKTPDATGPHPNYPNAGWVWTDHGDGTGHTEPSILVHAHHDWGPDNQLKPGFHTPYHTEWTIVDDLEPYRPESTQQDK